MSKKKFSVRERNQIVRVGRELHIFTDADVAYIMDPANDESACQRRLITARRREEPAPQKADKARW